MTVRDRFRQPRGAGREQDPQRRVELDVLEAELVFRHGRMIEQRFPQHCVLRRQHAIVPIQVRQVDHALERRQAADDLLHLRAAAERLAAILVAIYAKQDLRGQLREAVQHAARAEVRPAARPDGADAGRRQHRDHRLGNVRQARDDAVAGLHAQLAQLGGEHTHLAAELFPRQRRDLLALRQVQHRGGARPLVPQHVLRIVGVRAGKPARARHLARLQHGPVGRRGDAAIAVPDGLPEGFELRDRPVPERVIVLEMKATLLREPVHERRDVRARDALGRRCPEEVTFFDHLAPSIVGKSYLSAAPPAAPAGAAAASGAGRTGGLARINSSALTKHRAASV